MEKHDVLLNSRLISLISCVVDIRRRLIYWLFFLVVDGVGCVAQWQNVDLRPANFP